MQDEEAAVVKVCRFVDLSGENLDPSGKAKVLICRARFGSERPPTQGATGLVKTS